MVVVVPPVVADLLLLYSSWHADVADEIALLTPIDLGLPWASPRTCGHEDMIIHTLGLAPVRTARTAAEASIWDLTRSGVAGEHLFIDALAQEAEVAYRAPNARIRTDH